MDKEAQGKIIPILIGLARSIHPQRGSLIERLASDILVELERLGYCKLPKDKPLLLSDKEIEQIESLGDEAKTDFSEFWMHQDALERIAQAQRELDIKHYEG